MRLSKNLIYLIHFHCCMSLFAQTIQTTAVQSNAGGMAQSGSYALVAAIGQPSPLGVATGGQFILSGGFIYTLGDAQAPEFEPRLPTLPNPVPEAQALPLSVTVTDNVGISEVKLYYRQGGEANYTEASMQLNNSVYQADIPAAAVTSRGVEYYVKAIDLSGNSARDPDTGFISQPVSVARLIGTTLPGGNSQTGYRIVSFPLNLQDKSPKGVLEDDLGKYDKEKWRFFDENLNEYPNTGNFDSGEAFWLIVKGGATIDCGAGVTNRTAGIFEIELQRGWNLVSNPFNFDIPAVRLSFSIPDSGLPELQSYNGGWAVSNTMKPLEGYAVFSDTVGNKLVIGPPGSSATINQPEPKWFIEILAASQEAKDHGNIAGVVAKAMADWDLFDRPEPPVIGEYVSVYFPHREWQKTTDRFRSDIRPEPKNEEGLLWEFAVQTNIHDKVNLGFENLASVPEHLGIWIADENLNVAQNLRERSHYEVAGPTENIPKRLWLIVGSEDFILEKIGSIVTIPGDYELSQNFPNPFNPATTLRFGLPQPEDITLKIYNVLGQEVITLLNKEFRKGGYHAVIWDGRNQHGQPVASGVYIYRFEAGKFVKTGKMIMVR